MGKTEGLRPKGEIEKTTAGFRGIRPSQSDVPFYQGVPDGKSATSEPSVVQQIHVEWWLLHAVFFARRAAEDLEYSIFDAEEGFLPWRGTAQ